VGKKKSKREKDMIRRAKLVKKIIQELEDAQIVTHETMELEFVPMKPSIERPPIRPMDHA